MKLAPVRSAFFVPMYQWKGRVSMAIFKGAGVAIVTPFHEDGSINYDKFEQLVNEQIEGGTDAIIVCGTTGEASTLTHEEHLDLISFCVEKVNGRVPVIAGTGSTVRRRRSICQRRRRSTVWTACFSSHPIIIKRPRTGCSHISRQ